MKKIVALALVAASVISLSAMNDDPADICETELMACNNNCDTNTPTEICYQECQEKYEDCLATADQGEAQPEGEEEPKEK
jgi:hypothetical protein